MMPSSSVVTRMRLCVLLVDDEAGLRSAVGRQLHTLGWEVVAVATGEEAIRVAEGGEVVDVLLTDLQLPDIDGVAVARAVTALSPRTRVAFMSGSAPQRPLDPSDAPFLLKPFSVTALANALAETLAT